MYGYTYSENGWRMCNRDECAIVNIPNLYLVDTAPLRKGAPLTILGAWIYWYDRNVEEILTPVWGWSATNDVPNSNHLAGTAVDICAPKYPWGSRTMSAAKKAKVREGLKLFEGSVFWGADWSKADEMHYQMAWPEGDKWNDAFAKKLLDGYLGIYKPAPSTPTPTPTKPEAPVVKKFPDDWTDREILVDILQQLRGYGLNGFPQLGKNDKGQSLTVVDKLATL